MRILHIIEKSVNIHARDKTGRTPLSVALLNGNTKMAEWLLGTGADPNLADKTGWTPLHIICMRCPTFLIKFLKIIEDREPPVEFNAKTIEGRTPLKLLREYKPTNYKNYSSVLEKLGARLD
ncbi:ankyrin repeat and protein kinase domain-containing protein 1-like [Trichogramma pretiosum]|uniref:ankyrin repeat and protein kinase domain-containing protein 1-like n=1 Tax=Trichogramma pretiosum TaxID=7493 RepID=UPI0006C942D3|nr:ankyrin repeat and protein kinase domain-containing protein 1-like [Trichogramma pretiosum]